MFFYKKCLNISARAGVGEQKTFKIKFQLDRNEFTCECTKDIYIIKRDKGQWKIFEKATDLLTQLYSRYLKDVTSKDHRTFL